MSLNPYVTAARALADEISVSARQTEQQRKMPDDLVQRRLSAGLFHLGTPTALGGAECEPSTIIEVVEEVSRADGSAGWNVFVASGPRRSRHRRTLRPRCRDSETSIISSPRPASGQRAPTGAHAVPRRSPRSLASGSRRR